MEARIRKLVARLTCGYSKYDKLILLRSKIPAKISSECKDTPAHKALPHSYTEIIFSDLGTPQKNFAPLFGKVANLRTNTQKTKNKRVATRRNLSVACPKTASKVRAIGARRLVRVNKKKRKKKTKQRETHKTKTKETTKHHHTRTTKDHTPTTTDHKVTKVWQTSML